MKKEFPGRLSPLLAVLFCWAIFLAIARRVWPFMGIGVGEEEAADISYRCIHRLPGWHFPLMTAPYHGPWSIYIVAPFVWIGGATLASLRLYAAVVFLLALWGTHRLARAVCRNEAAAFLATLLLATCPTMPTFCAINVNPLPGIAFSAWSLSFGLSFARTRRPVFAYSAVGAFFAGLCCHSCFAALGVGLLLGFVLMPRRWLALLPEGRREKSKLLAGCLAVAGIFLLPILVYNVRSGGETIRFFLRHLIARDPPVGCWGDGSCSNLDYWANLRARFSELALLCDGDLVATKMPWHLAYAAGLLVSLAVTAREAWRRRTLWSAPAVLWIAAIGYLLISPISPTDQSLPHMIPLAPIAAVLLFAGLGFGPPRRVCGALLAAGAVLCAAQGAGALAFLDRDNVEPHDTAWYGLSPLLVDVSLWAADRPRTPVVPLSAPLGAALSYFGEGRARILAPYEALQSQDAASLLNRWLRRRDRPFFLVENDLTGSDALAALKAEAARIGAPLARVKVFTDPSGHPEFEVYKVR